MEKKEDGQSVFPSGTGSEPPVLVRRKRKAARKLREKTPEAAKAGRSFSEQENRSTVDEPSEVLTVELQIAGSSHKSNILSRKNKNLCNAASRSLSTPRGENSTEALETYDFLRVARRSVSSSRHKEESRESRRYSPLSSQVVVSQRTQFSKSQEDRQQQSPQVAAADLSSDSQSNVSSRLEKNLKRFEEERRKFELERKRFEREKRELTWTRYKVFDSLDRRLLVESNRKTNDGARPTTYLSDKQLLLEMFLESQQKAVLDRKQIPRRSSLGDDTEETDQEIPPNNIECLDYESSTATMSESEISTIDADETDADDEENPQPEKLREKRTNISHSSTPTSLRSRRSLTVSKILDDSHSDDKERSSSKRGFLLRIFSFLIFKKKSKRFENVKESSAKPKTLPSEMPFGLNLIKLFFQLIFTESFTEWKKLKKDYPTQVNRMRLQRNKCISHLIVLIIICGFGGILFRFLEGKLENTYKCGVGKVKRDFIDRLWLSSHNLREEDWKSQARIKLRTFEEELHAAHEFGINSYSGMKSWNFLNSLIYCWTVVTKIGYGHISPTTVVGRAVTIIYAIIGIPMFLILLADFGKLFTRGIKFLWVFVRRMYYTGTFRNIRKHHNVQQMVHGMNIVYEIAMRRPTLPNMGMFDPEKADSDPTKTPGTPPSHELHGSTAETPTSPVPETFLIDDEFNLPISVAIIILLLYIFVGAAVYCIWEEWTYFESIYFVFISMSTVGFGDFVPQHPIFMMCSIAYLIFGLALTSMCINVVQVKLSDSFKQASVKIGATIGFEMSDEEAISTQNQTPIEIPSIPSSPRLERQLTMISNHELNTPNISSDSPPPLPRRSPLRPEENEKGKENEKNKKNKKNKKSFK